MMSSRPRIGYLTYGLDRPVTGIGRYAVELARALASYDDQLAIILLNPFAGQPARLDGPYSSARIYGRLLPTLMASGPLQIATIAHRRRLDVVHDPMGIAPFLVPRRISPFRRIVTIHDVVPFIYPEMHARLTNLLYRHYIPRTLPFTDHIITDSQASKRDIIRHLNAAPEQITVIPCGVSEQFTPASEEQIARVRKRYGLPEYYILTVGALQARKNLGALFESYRLLRQRGLAHRLVLVGKKAWKSSATFHRLRELGLEDDVILTGYVSDNDLPALYSGADAFAFPSIYEGFGLPPLEAMACGTPVVSSASSSLPEVVGDAGLLFKPNDISGFASALERVLVDRDLARCYRHRGLERARFFTWRRAARDHLELYLSLTRGSDNRSSA